MQRKGPLPGKIFARCILRRRFAGLFGCMARTSCQSQLVLDARRANLATKPPFSRPRPLLDTWSEKIATDCRLGTHFTGILPSVSARNATAPCASTSCVAAPSMLAPNGLPMPHVPDAHAPPAARHSTMTPCAVRGAFVAAEKVSCGLRVSMR